MWDSTSSWRCNHAMQFLTPRGASVFGSLSLFPSLLKRKSNPEFSRYHNNSREKLQNQKAQVLQSPPRGPIPTASFVNSEAQRHQLLPAHRRAERNSASESGSGAEQPTPLLVRRRLPGPWPWPPPPPGCSGRPAPPPTSGSPHSPGPSPPVRIAPSLPPPPAPSSVSGALVPRITAPRGWYRAILCRFARV
jgi:hypothetical protein